MKIREFVRSGGSQQENFANFGLEEFLKHYIFTQKIFTNRKIHEIFLHAKISCFTCRRIPVVLIVSETLLPPIRDESIIVCLSFCVLSD